MEQDPAIIMAASEALRKKAGLLKCPICGCKQPESNFHVGTLQTSAFRTYGVICPNCGYLLQFDLRKLLAE